MARRKKTTRKPARRAPARSTTARYELTATARPKVHVRRRNPARPKRKSAYGATARRANPRKVNWTKVGMDTLGLTVGAAVAPFVMDLADEHLYARFDQPALRAALKVVTAGALIAAGAWGAHQKGAEDLPIQALTYGLAAPMVAAAVSDLRAGGGGMEGLLINRPAVRGMDGLIVNRAAMGAGHAGQLDHDPQVDRMQGIDRMQGMDSAPSRMQASSRAGNRSTGPIRRGRMI